LHPVAVTKLQRRHWFQQIGQHFPDFLHLAGFLLYRQLPGDCSVRINADAAKHYIQLGGVERLADIHRKIPTDLASAPRDFAPKNASRDEAVSKERLGAMSLDYPEA
jgi:hypothetical protein